MAKHLLFFILVSFFPLAQIFAQSIPIQVIGIDFDNNKGNTPSDWNNANRGSGSGIADLRNQQDQPTGYSMEVTAAFNGAGMSGLSTGNNSDPVPDAVMATFWYKQNGTATLKLTLDNTKRYRFRFYGGRDGNNDDKSSDYTIGGTTVTLYNWNNLHNEAVIDNVFPDANNEVIVSVKNSPGYAYAILNAITIEEYATSNVPPVLTAVPDRTVSIGESISISLSATDADGDPLAFSISGTTDFVSLVDNGDGTAEILASPSVGDIGAHEVTVSVSDGNGGETSVSFTLTVVEQGMRVPLQVIGVDFDNWKNNTPTGWNNTSNFGAGSNIDNLQNRQGQSTGYTMEVTAPFNGSGLGGLSTGNNSGPVPDAVMATFWYKQNGAASMKFTLDNTKRYRFRLYGGRDGNNDDKSSDYSIGSTTVTLYNWNNVNNEAIIANVTPDVNHEVLVSVKNSPGYTYAILNAITIEEYLEGSPPVIATVADQTVTVGNVLSIPLSAADADGDSVAFSVSGEGFISLAGLSDTTAIIQVSPEEGDEGAYNIQVSVSDGKGGEDSTTFLLTVVPNEGEIPDSIEYQALVDLYNSTNGDGWTNSTNWLQGNTSADFAAWHGITARGGDVVQIALPNNSLRGGLPNSIGKLTKLENLYLSYNKINSLPSNMGNLTWLFSLRLENNELTSLPPTIGNLNFLFEIDLRHNKLNFLPSEIGGLSNLLFLDLDDNNLASLPNSIGNLSNLFRLEVRSNKLDSLPRQIGNLINLESLYLAFNKLRSLPQEIGNLSALRYLYAHDNQLVELPSTIGDLSNLENLYIDGNELTRLPSTMGNLYSLKEIGLWNNLVTALPSELSGLSTYELRWIHAENNRLGMKSIEQFFSGPNTYKLSAFTFSPQSPPPPETIAVVQYSTLTLESDDNAPHNRYQWQREMNGTWTDIGGATGAAYTISSVTEGGKYRCKITNDWVTDMTLYSRTIHVEVEERLMPTPPVDMVRNRPVDGMP